MSQLVPERRWTSRQERSPFADLDQLGERMRRLLEQTFVPAMISSHGPDCICFACRRERRGGELRAESIRRRLSYERPVPCESCAELVVPGPTGRRFCTNRCRQKAYRRRQCVFKKSRRE